MSTNDIRSNEQLLEYIKENGKPEIEFFYGGHYSQWSRSPFEYNDETYLTAEHWMMVKKAETFGDEQARAEIFTHEHPSKVKAIGRRVKNFDPDEWARVAYDYVVEGNVKKFSQNSEHMKTLIKDDGLVLVEASPSDKIWGIGINEHTAPSYEVKDWKGTNLLGYAIMEARELLR